MLLSASMVLGSPEAADAVTESQLIFLEVRQLLLLRPGRFVFPRAAADESIRQACDLMDEGTETHDCLKSQCDGFRDDDGEYCLRLIRRGGPSIAHTSTRLSTETRGFASGRQR